MSKLSVAILAVCCAFSSAASFADDPSQQLEEMVVMGAVKSRDANDAKDIEAKNEPELEALPVVEE